MKTDPLPTQIQKVFLASKVNGALYTGSLLAHCPHAWPADTWFQKRLEEMRRKEEADHGDDR